MAKTETIYTQEPSAEIGASPAMTIGAYNDLPNTPKEGTYNIGQTPASGEKISRLAISDSAYPPSVTVGAYGSKTLTPQRATAQHVLMDTTIAKPVLKPTAAPAFDDLDASWLKELGITVLAPREFARMWENDKQRYRPTAWNESTEGRVAIRTVSRGILGAAFFATGQMASDHLLGSYNVSRSFSEQRNFLQKAAKGLDSTVGAGIKLASKTVYKILHQGATAEEIEKFGEKAVTFRETRYFRHTDKTGKAILGRSYGHEALASTVDFGAASLGDHFGRSIANLLDPNIQKPWDDKDGHFSVSLATKSLLANVWEGVTRAMGEDYFAMLFGYPYVMRLSRHLINKTSPGFLHDSDVGANGSSLKIANASSHIDPQSGKTFYVPKVVGNYHIEGMLDLGTRFTIYNWYTKIFRDGYDWTGDKISRLWNKDPSLDMHKEVKEGILSMPRAIVRDIMKTTITMIPAATVFGFLRTAQSRDWGLLIDKELGPMMGESLKDLNTGGPLYHAVNAGGKVRNLSDALNDADLYHNKSNESPWKYISPLRFLKHNNTTAAEQYVATKSNNAVDIYFAPVNSSGKITNRSDVGKSLFRGPVPYKGPDGRGFQTTYDPYEVHTFSDKIFAPLGRIAYQVSHVVTEIIKPVFKVVFGNTHFKPVKKILKNYFGIEGNEEVSKLARIFTYASFAYTPYFAVKTDILTPRNDTPRMDRANDEVINGLLHWNANQFLTGVGDTVRTMFNYPFSNPAYDHIARAEMHEFYNTAPGAGQQNAPHKQVRVPQNYTATITPRAPIVPKSALPVKSASRDNMRWRDAVTQFDTLDSPQGHAIH